MERSQFQIDVPDRGPVSALLLRPAAAHALCVLGHGAGAGMHHPFMESIAAGLAERDIATLRYQFPYMEAGRRSPDPPRVLEHTVRAAISAASDIARGLTIIAGGKSLGGRISSHVAAGDHPPSLRGLVFLGYPLHAPKQPATKRAAHLDRVRVPMLFLQGTRDDLADLSLMEPIVRELGPRATLHVVDGGDHSFSVLKRSQRTHHEVMNEILSTMTRWIAAL